MSFLHLLTYNYYVTKFLLYYNLGMNLFSDLDLDVQSISYDHLFCLNSYHPSS